MKLTDFSIVFAIFAVCVFLNLSFQNDLMAEAVYQNTMCNNVMDNLTEDALRFCVTYENYMPVIDREKVIATITDTMAQYYMGMTSGYGEYLKECIKLVLLTYPDGFYIAGTKNGEVLEWEEKIFFSEGKMTRQEEKVSEILRETQQRYGIDLFISSTGEDTLSNTIEDYQLLLVYETYPYIHHGKEYKKLLFSGAKVRHGIQFT